MVWPHSRVEIARDASSLQTAIRHVPNLLTDARFARGAIADLFSGDRGKVRLLAAVVELDLVESLRAPTSHADARARAESVMMREGFDSEAASWALTVWTRALNEGAGDGLARPAQVRDPAVRRGQVAPPVEADAGRPEPRQLATGGERPSSIGRSERPTREDVAFDPAAVRAHLPPGGRPPERYYARSLRSVPEWVWGVLGLWGLVLVGQVVVRFANSDLGVWRRLLHLVVDLAVRLVGWLSTMGLAAAAHGLLWTAVYGVTVRSFSLITPDRGSVPSWAWSAPSSDERHRYCAPGTSLSWIKRAGALVLSLLVAVGAVLASALSWIL